MLCYPYFSGLVLPSGQQLTSGLLATITLEVVPFHAYALLLFLIASRKSCSVRVFSTACDSVSITSSVSKWLYFQLRRGVGENLQEANSGEYGGYGTTVIMFWSKIPWWKRKYETVRCRDETASSFVIKVRDEVFAHFHAMIVKCHSGMRN
jgi:hypothetical protein